MTAPPSSDQNGRSTGGPIQSGSAMMRSSVSGSAAEAAVNASSSEANSRGSGTRGVIFGRGSGGEGVEAAEATTHDKAERPHPRPLRPLEDEARRQLPVA